MKPSTGETPSVAQESATLMAGRALSFIIAVALPLILVRVLIPEQFGLYRQLFLVHGTLASILTLGLGAGLFYFVPRHPSQKHLYVFHTLFALSVLGLLGAVGVTTFRHGIALALNSPELESYLPPLALFSMLSVITSPLENLMVVHKRIRLATLAGIQSEVLRSGLMIAAALWTHNLFVLILAGVLWAACRLVMLLVYLPYADVPFWLKPRWHLFREQFAYSIPFASAVLVASLNENFHQYVISYATNPVVFAIYSVGYLQIPFVTIVFDSICDITLVRVTELVRDSRLVDAAALITVSTRRVALFLVPAYAWLLLNARDFIVLLYTERFEPSVPIFQLFLTLIPLTVMTTDYVLRAFADTPFIFYGHVVRFAIGALLLALLVPSVGITGAAIATVVATAFHRVIVTARVSRLLRVSSLQLLPWAWLGLLLAISLAFAGLAYLTATLATDRRVARLALSGGLFSLAYGPLMLLLDHERSPWLTAIRRAAKRWAAAKMPRLYSYATRVFDQLVVEYKAIRRMGIAHFMPGRLGSAEHWQDVLPMQKPRHILLADSTLRTWHDLVEELETQGLSYSEGGHTIYLPPQSARRTSFAAMLRDYPPTAGIKFLKHHGGPSDTHYVSPEILSVRGESRIQYELIHSHPHLAIVANLLFTEGVGARLFDLVEIECGSTLWTAYVVEHVEGREPSLVECQAGVNAIQNLERRGLIRVILPEGFEDPEFKCPGCNGNAMTDRSGAFRYVDFQNFRLVNYDRFLKGLVMKAAKESHFGDRSVLRGGRYLYQPVPGVSAASKRDTQLRMATLRNLMASAGVSVAERLVLDIGCNIGAMMAEYLKLGAKWCHGWDRAHVAVHTNRVLLALGCTRFSLSGGDLHRAHPIEADIPNFLSASLPGCAISFLAVRGHLGWIEALRRIPWAFMIYEGHEDESLEDFHRHVAELNALVPVRVAEVNNYTDGDSSTRLIALLTRVPPATAMATHGEGTGATPETNSA